MRVSCAPTRSLFTRPSRETSHDRVTGTHRRPERRHDRQPAASRSTVVPSEVVLSETEACVAGRFGQVRTVVLWEKSEACIACRVGRVRTPERKGWCFSYDAPDCVGIGQQETAASGGLMVNRSLGLLWPTACWKIATQTTIQLLTINSTPAGPPHLFPSSQCTADWEDRLKTCSPRIESAGITNWPTPLPETTGTSSFACGPARPESQTRP